MAVALITKKRLLGAAAAVLLALAAVLGAGAGVENAGYAVAGVFMPSHAPNSDVVVVGIGADDLNRFGDWPWPRNLLAQLTDKLAAARARVIAFVPAFAAPQNAQTLDYLQRLSGLSSIRSSPDAVDALTRARLDLDTDAAFAASMRRAGNVLLATRSAESPVQNGAGLPSNAVIGTDDSQGVLSHLFGARRVTLRAPLDALGTVANGIGYVADHPGNAAQSLVVRNGDQLVPSLSLLVAARMRGANNADIKPHATGGISAGDLRIPTDAHLGAQAREYQSSGRFAIPVYAFGDVYTGAVSPDIFAGKAVLVGLTADGDAAPVMATAGMVSSILNQDVVAAPFWAWWLRGLCVLVVCAWLGFGLARLGNIAAVSVSAVLLILLANIEFIPLLARGVWLPMAYPFLLLALGHIGWLLWGRLRSQAGASSLELSDANRQLGDAYQQLGRYDEAFDSYRRCRPSKSVCDSMLRLAQDHERHRRYADAVEVYEEIQRIAPGFDDVAAHLEQLRQFETTPTLMGARRNGAHNLMFEGGLQKPMLGRYQLIKEIGRGAMGVVYLGRDPKIGRTVAIKTMSLAEEFDGQVLDEVSQRFYREAETAGRLNHPSIVTIYDVGDDQGLAYIAMDFLSGEALENFAVPGKLLPLDEAMAIVIKVAEALDYAHSQNVVHRDIKPGNIIYERETGRVKITDFGIASLTDVSKTRTGTILGSPSYMSPEQVSGRKVDGRSDLYSLGVTFYQLLRGDLPFESASLTGLMFKIANEPHPDVTFLRPDIPAVIKTVIDKALQKNAADRFQTGADMAKALRACQAKLKPASR
ncbi:MAG TPA: protein kinase [Gammaproteobacteria bacterium]|nr:protein kinase [Gammaproteobacteria bacterium]